MLRGPQAEAPFSHMQPEEHEENKLHQNGCKESFYSIWNETIKIK